MSINLFAREPNQGAEIAKASSAVEIAPGLHSYQAVVQASNTGSFVCSIEVSNEATPTNWITIGTITLSPNNNTVSDGFTSFGAWRHTRANITTFTGPNTLAKVWVS